MAIGLATEIGGLVRAIDWQVREIYYYQGITNRCRLSWLTNSALFYEPKCGGMGVRGGGVAGSQPMSTAVHLGPKNFGDLTPYLTYDCYIL